MFSVLLSAAVGNSCLLHLSEGFVSLVVWKVALVLQNAADSQFKMFQKADEQFQGRKIHYEQLNTMTFCLALETFENLHKSLDVRMVFLPGGGLK